MPLVGHAVLRRVLAHRRHDDAVRQLERARGGTAGTPAGGRRGTRSRARRGGRTRSTSAGSRSLEVVVRDALAARHQVEHEPLRALARVALAVLEPLEARLRGALDLEHVDAARVLVGASAAGTSCDVVGRDRVGERDRVLHRELGAGADREVRRVRRVAEQHDVLVAPRPAADRRERAPDRPIDQQLLACEVLLEQLLAERRRLLLVELVEPGLLPRLLAALDDPRAAPLLERIGVHLEQPPLRRLEDERERRHLLGRAEPGELALAPVERRLERVRVELAHARVDAVGGEHEVVVGDDLLDVVDGVLEVHAHAELAAALLQQQQQLLAREAAEAVAGAGDLRAGVERVDVGPVGEVLADAPEALRVGLLELAERLVGEHDAPAEGVVRLVLLEDVDLRRGHALLEQDGEVERRGAAADARDLHGSAMLARFAHQPHVRVRQNRVQARQMAEERRGVAVAPSSTPRSLAEGERPPTAAV